MPARIEPKNVNTKSSLFGRMRATRSPLRRPRACRAPPYLALNRSRAVYENLVSLAGRPVPIAWVAFARSGELGAACAALEPGLANPAIPASDANVRPREASALAASSIASGMVRNAMGRSVSVLRFTLTRARRRYQGRLGAL